MALLGPELDPMPPGAPQSTKPAVIRPLTKLDIIRHGTGGWTRLAYRQRRPMPPPTEKQRACREPMRFARAYYYNPAYVTKSLWNDVDPVDMFCEGVKRWLAAHSPAASPYYTSDEPSAITVTASATASINAMILRFTPSDYCALWGVAIIRSQYPIVTPTWPMLRFIYPTTTVQERTWLDHPLPAGVWHYRFAACETDGKLGPFSTDVFDTIP